jgi:hypothetical protein
VDKLLLRGFVSGHFGLGGIALGVLAAETFNATRGIQQLLLARKKRVAGSANFDVQVTLVGRPGRKTIAARAQHADFFVGWMDSSLHISLSLNSNPLILQDGLEIQQPSKWLIVRLLQQA